MCEAAQQHVGGSCVTLDASDLSMYSRPYLCQMCWHLVCEMCFYLRDGELLPGHTCSFENAPLPLAELPCLPVPGLHKGYLDLVHMLQLE